MTELNKIFRTLIVGLLVTGASVCSAQIVISDAQVKAPIPGQMVSAGYFSLKNHGDDSRKLIAVSSVNADRIEMHTHVHEGGMMSMKKLEFVEISAKSSVEFTPGANHLMIFSLEEAAITSGLIELVFEFQNGEALPVSASIEDWN